MGLADDLARHNADLARAERDKSRHDLLHLLHVGPPPAKPAKSCRLCRNAKKLAEIEAQVRAGKLVRG